MNHMTILQIGKGLLLLAAVLAVSAVVVMTGLNLWVTLSVRDTIMDAAQAGGAECILVLGCGLKQDGTPGTYLQYRLDTAIGLYRQGAAPKLLMSGDHGRQSYDEVNAMKRYAVQHGVPAEDVFMDHAGFSTYESMVRAAKLFRCRQIIVVTQGFHLHRALYDAVQQGMKATGVIAQNFDGAGWKYNLYLQGRELMARCKDVFWCALHIPVDTGDQVIPIIGSGTATDDENTARWLREME